eukprot:Gb_18730 [translate_table: standard]
MKTEIFALSLFLATRDGPIEMELRVNLYGARGLVGNYGEALQGFLIANNGGFGKFSAPSIVVEAPFLDPTALPGFTIQLYCPFRIRNMCNFLVSSVTRIINYYTTAIFLYKHNVELFCIFNHVYVIHLIDITNAHIRRSKAKEKQAEKAFEGIAPYTSPPSTVPAHICDVFINHRGVDVKKTLATNIYHTLRGMGLHVFLDVEEFELGDDLPVKIQDAMSTASVHLAIFSKNYARSPWCLAELAFMMKTGGKIIPVFYNTEVSHIRYLKGDYGAAFAEHRSKGRYDSRKLQEWEEALKNVSFRFGCEFKDNIDDEGNLLKNIVRIVSKEVSKVPLEVATHPVGLDQAITDFENKMSEYVQQLQPPPEKAMVAGLVGMGGAGKTTLAKELYNRKRYSFDGASFLFDVREASQTLEKLQSQLLKEALNFSCEIKHPDQGKGILRYRLRDCRVLIVLDDIDHKNQLDALLVKDVLGSGSLIIITSRHKDVLKQSGASFIYPVKGLDAKHAKELFCWHAFLQPNPGQGFEGLVQEYLVACDGLPLSLKVFGSLVFGHGKDYWESELKKITRILPEDIIGRLRISYDALDEEQKQIFLDIAFFFRGEDRNLSVRIWDASELSGLQALELKCLVEIDDSNCLKMHDHFRDLGRKIADSSLPCRLWRPDINILRGRTTVLLIDCFAFIIFDLPFLVKPAPVEVRGIVAANRDNRFLRRNSILHYEPPFEEIQILGNRSGSKFSVGLKLLAIKGDCVDSKFSNLLGDLIWLRWYDCPHPTIPSWFSLNNLRVLELIGGSFEEWPWQCNGWQNPLKLRELNITCNRLGSFPKSIGMLTRLEKMSLSGLSDENLPEEFCRLRLLAHLELCFGENLTSLPKGCRSLIIEPEILGSIRGLEHLDFSNCKELRVLPTQTTSQGSLRTLHLIGTSLQELPNDFGKLRNLRDLRLGSPFLMSLPPSLDNLKRLTHMELQSCPELKCLPDSLEHMTGLANLEICQSGVEYLPKGVAHLPNLQTFTAGSCPLSTDSNFSIHKLKHLSLVRTKISKISIPENDCPNLETLDLSYNEFLTDVETLPTTLVDMTLRECRSLKRISGISSLQKLQKLDIRQCCELKELSSLPQLRVLKADDCWELQSIEGPRILSFLERLEADCCWKLQNIPGLESLERLKYLKLSADNKAIWSCMHGVQRLPSTMILSGRAEPEVEAAFKGLSFPDLTVVEALGARQCDHIHYWALDVPLEEVSSWSAVIICFVVRCSLSLREFSVDVFPRGLENRYTVTLRKGEWVYISIFTKDSAFMEDVNSSDHKAVIVRRAVNTKVKKGWMFMVDEGDESKILEVLHTLLTLLQ